MKSTSPERGSVPIVAPTKVASIFESLLLVVVLARLHIQVEIEAAVVTAAEMQPCIEASACKARLAFCF